MSISEDRKRLQDKSIGMIGYGAQGCAEAKNLKKSELNFSLGLRKNGKTWKQAEADGFQPKSIEEVVSNSRILLINIPDQSQAEVYERFIKKSEVEYLVFAHGFSTYFERIPLEDSKKHILIAPKGAASGLEKFYRSDNALPAILAFRSEDSSEASQEEKLWIEALARCLGAHPKALVWADFKDETVCDLFSEQALLCGGVSSLLRRTYEVLVEGGYNPETAYFETLFELKLIVDMIWSQGISGMRDKISPTARYGDVSRGDRIFGEEVKSKMKQVLKEIESGKFADEFLNKIESPEFKKKVEEQANHPIEKIGKELRSRLRA